MTLPAMEKMCDASAVFRPKDIEIMAPFWSVSRAGKAGGSAKYKKYGSVASSEKVRKGQWEKWWERKGRQDAIERSTKHITIPERSESLAELVGILLGDGGITRQTVSVTLDAKTDKAYAVFVSKRIKELFGVVPKRYFHKTARAVTLVVARRELSDFCCALGLPIGNKIKQGIHIPDWVVSDPVFARACVRGLVDTDGCFFTHSYRSAGKEYSYLKIDFTSRSPRLLADVAGILQKEGFYVKLSSRACVRIESKEGVARYIRVFGTSNPKHLKKIKIFRSRV